MEGRQKNWLSFFILLCRAETHIIVLPGFRRNQPHPVPRLDDVKRRRFETSSKNVTKSRRKTSPFFDRFALLNKVLATFERVKAVATLATFVDVVAVGRRDEVSTVTAFPVLHDRCRR